MDDGPSVKASTGSREGIKSHRTPANSSRDTCTDDGSS
jgi:hypothetical protein